MCSVVADSLRPHGLKPTILLWPWNFPGKNTGVGCLFLLPGIFLSQELSPSLLHCRQILYHWATWEAMERLNHLPLGCPPSPITVQPTDGEGPGGQGRTEQAAPVSTRNSALPATSRVTQGSAEVMKMDQAGSISRQALGPHQSLCELSHPTHSQRTGVGQGCPLGVPQEGTQDIPPFQCPPFWQKHIGSGPGGLLGVCPAFSVLQGPFEVVAESKQPRAAFSLLVFYAYWPPPSSLGS